MKLYIITIFDKKAQLFEAPKYARSHAEAIRVYADLANDKRHPIGQHPEDYYLEVLGEFDDSNGQFELYSKKETLGCAMDYVKPEELPSFKPPPPPPQKA